jgi:hypothetical protein
MASGEEFSQAELRALPRACQAQKFINEMLQFPTVPEHERLQFETLLGQDYIHYHHHCMALMYVRRANHASDSRSRLYNYNQAIANFSYVQRNASSAFPLLPDVYLQKGFVYRLIGSDVMAAREFVGAIELKATYTPAYGALIDYYLDLGDLEQARLTVDAGLRLAPGSKLLQEKKIEIESRERKTLR